MTQPELSAAAASTDVGVFLQNGRVPAVAQVLELAHLAERDSAWKLLRADSAPVVAGLLGTHLGGDERRVDAEELYERIDADLERLRAQGLILPLTAKGYCGEWRSAGFLVRRPSSEARGETLELSPDAIAGIRFLQGRAAPRSSVTESRLASLAAQVRRLAIDTDPDVSARIALLEEEIESPFLRPSRVPLGQMSKGTFVRMLSSHPMLMSLRNLGLADDLIRRTGVDLSLDEFADEEHPDGQELELEYPEEGEEAEEEDNEEDEDPARGRDSGMVYAYPPADPQDRSWLANMLHALEQDGFAVQAELTRLRDVANKLSSELLLAEAEMDEEVIECNAFVENIRHFAGDAVVKRILDTASKIKVPEFQVDEYVDEEEYEEEYEEPGAEPTEEQESQAHTEEAEA